MHLLYLDASGDSGWCPPNGKSTTRWYVLLGLSMEEGTWMQAHTETKQLLRKYFPTVFFPMREVRYSALIAGASPYDTLTKEKRKSLADDIFSLIINLKPILFASAIDKVAHKVRYGANALSPHVWALQLIAPRFHKYLIRTKGYGLMVMDAEESRRDARLKQLIQRAREHGIIRQSFLDPFRTNTTLPRLVESVLFVNSEESPGIQLADFCSHAVWNHFERQKSDRFNQIFPLFDKDNKNVYGLKKWPP